MDYFRRTVKRKCVEQKKIINRGSVALLCKGLFLLHVAFTPLCGVSQLKIHLNGALQKEVHTSDTLERLAVIRKVILGNVRKGFPFCQIDSSSESSVWIHKGVKASLRIDSVVYEEAATTTSRIRHPYKWITSLVSDLGNHGYPFARVSIRPNRATSGNEWHAFLQVDHGPNITWDSIHFVTPIKTRRSYIYKLAGIHMNESFSEKTFSDISTRIEQTPFFQLSTEPDISFASGKAIAYLDLKEIPTSTFEGVVGLLSGQSGESKTVVTGYLSLHLDNLFLSGKSLDIKWSRYASESQSLALTLGYPFPLGTRIFADFGFSLLKQDTSFLTQTYLLNLSAYMSSATRLIAGLRSQSSSLIEANEHQAGSGLADFTVRQYKIGVDYNKYERPFPFMDGAKASVAIYLGQKQIRKNATFPPSFYDTLSVKGSSGQVEVGVKGQKVLGKRSAFFQSLSYARVGSNHLFENELFRIGGIQTLRGFNENAYYTRQYVVSQIEWRQYFESRSYFLLFYDQAWVQAATKNLYPTGLGAGFSLATPNGLLNFVMAAGGDRLRQLNIAEIKVHIGYQAVF